MKLSERMQRVGARYEVDAKTFRKWGHEIAQLEAENEALGELLSGLVDIELERDTTKAALDVAMRENQRLTKLLEESE